MDLIGMYERVNLIEPVEQRRFFDYYADSVDELTALYNGRFVFKKNSEYKPPSVLGDENVVLPLYHDAIVDNILFLLGKDEIYKTEFLRKSALAYKKYWHDNARGRRVRRMGW